MCSLVGCAAPYRSRSVGVTVRDAETHQPIPDAMVRVSHHHLAEDPASEKTSADGIARVSFTPSSGESVMIEASAPGHLTEFQVVGDVVIASIPAAPLLGSAPARGSDFVVDLYAGPAFGVQLVVPPAYRGLLKVDLSFRDDIPIPPGQRLFSFAAAADGRVTGSGPGVLRRVPTGSYCARYADGTAIGETMDANQVGMRWLKRDGHVDIFVIATQPEYEQYRKEAGPDASTASPSNSDAGKRGGHGKRGGGRRGGM